MKSYLTWNQAQRLERLFHQSPRTGRTWKTRFNDLWQTVIAHVTISEEPHVWHSRNEQGHMVWNGYDPRTQRSLHNASASEMRVWLEDRHYSF